MAEERLSIFRADAECFEHFFLQFWLVNSNATATDFHAIEHDVIGFGTNVRKLLCLKYRHVFRFRSREGMMHGVPFVFFKAPFEERKVCHPEEVPLRRALIRAGMTFTRPIMQILPLRDEKPQTAKNFAGDSPCVRAEEDAVA